MDGMDRLFYNLNIFLTTLPLAMLRFWPFRRDTRIPVRCFWGIYGLILSGELFCMNFWSWPEPIAFELRQRLYLLFVVLFTLLFFLGIRRFWQQLFVFCVLSVYGMAVLYLAPLIGNKYFLWMPAYSVSCIIMVVEYALTWRWMQRFLERDFASLYASGSSRFWHMAWLLPFVFFVVDMVFSLEHTSGNFIRPVSLLICYIGCIGLWAGIRTMQRCVFWLQENRILEQNIGEARKLYELQLARCQEKTEEARQARRLRHDLRHFAMELEQYVHKKDWSAFSAALGQYQQRLDEGRRHFHQEGEH